MLQRYLDRLSVWAYAWSMQYNVDKGEVIHFGSKNRKTDYYLNGCKLREVGTHGNFGVLVHQSLKVNMQVEQAVKKANCMLAFTVRGFEYRDVLFCCNCIGHW